MAQFLVVGGDDESEDFEEVDPSVGRRRNPWHPSQAEITVATGVAINVFTHVSLKLVPWTLARLKSKTTTIKKKRRKRIAGRR